LLDALYNEYASMVVGAFDAECARRGLDLLCFAGGSLHSPAGYERQRNRCFDLAGSYALGEPYRIRKGIKIIIVRNKKREDE